MCDGGDPRGELGFVPEIPYILIDFHENILANILTIRCVGNHPEDDVTHQPLVFFDQCLESVLIPGYNSGDESFCVCGL